MGTPDWAARAQAAKANSGGPTCSICKQPEVADGIRIMCEERAKGRANVTYSGMSDIVLEELGVEINPHTIRNHVASHLRDLHREIQAHERR